MIMPIYPVCGGNAFPFLLCGSHVIWGLFFCNHNLFVSLKYDRILLVDSKINLMSVVYKSFLFLSVMLLGSVSSYAYVSSCREISSGMMQNMMANPNAGFSNDNFIKLANGNGFVCMLPYSNSLFDSSVGPHACSSGHAILKIKNNHVADILKCSDAFYSLDWRHLPVCSFGANVKQPRALYLGFDYGDDRHILTQSRAPDTFYTRPTADGYNAVVIETYEYDFCRVNINDVCVSPTNNRVFPSGFSANVSYNKAVEISPGAGALLQTPRYIKNVNVSCESVNRGTIWREKINACVDGYELKNEKCVKKESGEIAPVEPTQPADKLPPLEPGPGIDMPGAVVQNPIGIAVPLPKLPVLDTDIDIPDSDIVIDDVLFENLDSKIVVQYLDIDGKPCNAKAGAYWDVVKKACVCVDVINTEWNENRTQCVENAAARARRIAQEKQNTINVAVGQISESVSVLQEMVSDMDVSRWRNADGKFNTARLASDSIAGVVLGTTGGLITSHVVKKNQIQDGFEDIKCVIGGQSVATYGDLFQVGIK